MNSRLALVAVLGSAFTMGACGGADDPSGESASEITQKLGGKSWFVGNRASNFAAGDVLRMQMDVPAKGQVRVAFAGAGCGARGEGECWDIARERSLVDVLEG